MAMGKVVVASDVAALAEIVTDGETGLLHKKDDVDHLAQVLETLLDNPELRNRLSEAGRKWVVAERDWKVLSRKVAELYEKLSYDHRMS
jgi:glycosyltransferase involved in cell wall biosynthesis